MLICDQSARKGKSFIKIGNEVKFFTQDQKRRSQSENKEIHIQCITAKVRIGIEHIEVADEDAVENDVQKGTIFNTALNNIDSTGAVNTVDIVSDDDNGRKKEVNDGLCGKSAPCCRGPRLRLSRTRHRLVID